MLYALHYHQPLLNFTCLKLPILAFTYLFLYKPITIRLGIFDAIGGGNIAVVAEATTNHIAPVLSSSGPARLHCKFKICAKIDTTFKMCSLKSAVSARHDCLNPIFLGDV